MDTVTLIKKLLKSSIVQSEIPLGLQMGLPWLERRNHSLCICFKPHREELEDEFVCYYPAQYEIAWEWPFEHLASFRKISLDSPVDVSRPCCRISTELLLSVGKHGMDELFCECTTILEHYEQNGSVTDACLRSYQRYYNELVHTLELQAIYGAAQF